MWAYDFLESVSVIWRELLMVQQKRTRTLIMWMDAGEAVVEALSFCLWMVELIAVAGAAAEV
jgi:hypothetical protein